MAVKSKLIVASSFSLRLPSAAPFHSYSHDMLTHRRVIAAAIVRLHRIDVIDMRDPFLSGVSIMIWTQVEMHYSLMASTIPCLKSFFARFNTGWGTAGDLRTQGDYPMSPFSNKSGAQTTMTSTSKEESGTRKDRLKVDVAQLRHSLKRERAPSLNSDSSTQRIIHKTTSWDVRHEDSRDVTIEVERPYDAGWRALSL